MINNRGDRGSLGENDATLKLFGEPRLNNPVVRFVDSAGEVSTALLPQAQDFLFATWHGARVL